MTSPVGHSGMTAEQPGSGRDTAVKSSLRTLRILELLSATEEELPIAEVSRTLNIPKSSLHGIMRTMAAQGWLATDASDTKYSLGLRAVLTSMSFLDKDIVVGVSRTALDTIAATTGEAVHLARLDGHEIVYLAKRDSQHALRLYSAVGRRLPAHATALGKAIMSLMSAKEVRELVPTSLPALTVNTITTRHRLLDDLAATRERGYAIDNGESEEGIYCLAVALAAERAQRTAISYSVPKARITAEGMATGLAALRQAAADIDELLSHPSCASPLS